MTKLTAGNCKRESSRQTYDFRADSRMVQRELGRKRNQHQTGPGLYHWDLRVRMTVVRILAGRVLELHASHEHRQGWLRAIWALYPNIESMPTSWLSQRNPTAQVPPQRRITSSEELLRRRQIAFVLLNLHVSPFTYNSRGQARRISPRRFLVLYPWASSKCSLVILLEQVWLHESTSRPTPSACSPLM